MKKISLILFTICQLSAFSRHCSTPVSNNLFGKEYDLPKVSSYHGSFHSWPPNGEMPNTAIALGYQVGDFFKPYFAEVNLVETIYNPYADSEEKLYQKIYVWRRPKQSFEKMKELFKHRIFE